MPDSDLKNAQSPRTWACRPGAYSATSQRTVPCSTLEDLHHAIECAPAVLGVDPNELLLHQALEIALRRGQCQEVPCERFHRAAVLVLHTISRNLLRSMWRCFVTNFSFSLLSPISGIIVCASKLKSLEATRVDRSSCGKRKGTHACPCLADDPFSFTGSSAQ